MHYLMIKEECCEIAKGEFEYRWINTETAETKVVWLKEGDVVDLERGQPHQLMALTEGATVFEVSSKHFEEDSYRVKKGDSQ